MLIRLFDPEKCDFEITLTINISVHGACVVSKRSWQPNVSIAVHAMDGGTYSSARVVHCQSIQDRGYAVGLELADPSSDWIEFNSVRQV